MHRLERIPLSSSSIKPDGEYLVSSSYSGEVNLWANNGVHVTSLGSFKHPVFNVSFSPDSKRILVTGAIPSLHVIDIADPQHPSNFLTTSHHSREFELPANRTPFSLLFPRCDSGVHLAR